MKTNRNHFNSRQGLYDPSYEHDACGVGMLVNIHGEKSHDIIESALKVLENMREPITKRVTERESYYRSRMSSSSCKEFRFQRKANMAPD